MIDQLLDFTRSRLGGGVPIQRQRADLAQVCRQAIGELQASHPGHDLLLEATGNCAGEWDPDRLAQLVGNLVANAIVHGDANTPVRVRALDEGPVVVLEVSNQGAIPPDLLPTVFEAFRRRTGGRPSRGLGLGLFISQEIVHAHAGTIRAQSSERERSTTLTVRLPRSAH